MLDLRRRSRSRRRAGSRSPIGILAGLAFGIPLHGVRRVDHRRQGPVRRSCSGSSSCRCSSSRARSTRSPRCRSGCSGSAGSRRSGTRPSSAAWPRTACRAIRLATVVHVAYLLGARRSAAGSSARRVFQKRLASMSVAARAGYGCRRRARQRASAVGGQPPVGRAARSARRAVVELDGRAVGLLRAGLLPRLDGHRPRRAHRRRCRPAAGVEVPYAAFIAPGPARRVGDERRDLRLDVERLLQAATTASSTRACCRRRSVRSTSRSARSSTRCCAACSTRPAS